MASSAAAALIAELENALERCPEHFRGPVVREAIKLLLAQQRENVGQLTSFDEVLARLISRAEVTDLANLSNVVAVSKLALPKTARQLAFHENASVAVPVLRKSDCLSDEALNELAETGGPEQLRAISSRAALSVRLSGALVMRGNAAVRLAISRNEGAHFAEATFAILLKIAERDEELAGALGKRPDIPAMQVRKFLALVRGQPRLAFLNSASAEIRALAGTRSEICTPIHYAAAEHEVVALNRAGKLTDSTLNRFAVRQDQERLVAALAVLSEAPVTTMDGLFRADSPDELVIACRAARLRWSTTASIVSSRQDCPPLSKQQLEDLGKLFQSFSLSEAQRTIRFGGWDTSAKGRSEPGKPNGNRSYH